MNNKITLPALVALLALKSGLSKEKSEEFIKDLFSIIADALQEGETVKVKGLCTFKLMNVETRKSVNVTNGEEITIPGHKRIVFLPSKELAEQINAPFSMFESVELHPDAESEIEMMLKVVDRPSLPDQTSADGESDSSDLSLTPEEKGVVEDAIPIAQSSSPEESAAMLPADSEGQVEEISEASNAPALIEKEKRNNRFIFGFITGLVFTLLIALGGYLFFIRPILSEKKDQVKEEEGSPKVENAAVAETIIPAETDTAAAEVVVLKGEEEMKSAVISAEEIPETQPSDSGDKKITDVIGDHRYLTTMAQQHYGNFNLWPYIYEENKRFLGHPDRIKPGTEVVIPSLSKFGVDPNNPEDIKKAKRLGVEIYARYK